MAVFLINICKFNGCGIKFDSLGELITHIENIHIGKCQLPFELIYYAMLLLLLLLCFFLCHRIESNRNELNWNREAIVSPSDRPTDRLS